MLSTKNFGKDKGKRLKQRQFSNTERFYSNKKAKEGKFRDIE